MLTQLIHRQLAVQERVLGAGTMDYVRASWRDARGAFWGFALARQVGAEAMVELAMAIAAARSFPTIKRAMGLAVSCSRVEVVA